MTCTSAPIRTGGLPPRPEREEYGYPVRMAAGFVRPEREALPERREPEPSSRAASIALGISVLLLFLFWAILSVQATLSLIN